jgi:hypothetical protein
MPKKKTKKKAIRPRERQILHLAKNGIVTVDIVHRCFFPQGNIEAARSALRRMVELGYLKSEPLDAQRVYYRLTPRGARLIAASRKYAQPLKRQGKIERYAVTWFVHADLPGHRVLLNPTDYPDRFPVAGHRLPRRPFFLDRSDGRSRLGVLFVDHNAHYRRMSRKTVAVLGRFLRHGWFDTFIRQDVFAVVILTFSPHRKQTFEKHVSRAIADQLGYPLSLLRPELAGAVPSLVHVHVIPELESMITQSQRENSKR